MYNQGKYVQAIYCYKQEIIMIVIIGNWILTTSWTVKHFGVRVDIINKDKCRLHIIGPWPNFSVVYYFSNISIQRLHF